MSQETQYLDLEVQVVRNTGGDLEVQILDSPRDRPQSRFEPPYSREESAKLLLTLRRLLEHHRSLAAGSSTSDGELPDIQEIGCKFFAALFPPALRPTVDGSLQRHRALRLRLSVDPEDDGLAHVGALPWELLFHPEQQEFLARRPELALVRYLDVPVDIERLFVKERLRVLLVAPAPTDCQAIDLGEEEKRITEILGRIDAIDLDPVEPPTLERLLECLKERETHVIHYMGHGGYDEALGESGLFFESADRKKDVVRSRHLADRLEPFFKTLRLVVLNTCLGVAGRRRAEHAPFGSVSSALIAKGLPAVVGMQFSISNKAAERFAKCFYRRLVETGHVEAAAAEARCEIHRLDQASPEWMIPVLVTRAANGRLFDPGDTPAAGEPLRVGIRSIFGWGVELEDWSHAFLPLTSFFRGRRPLEEIRWQEEIYDHLATFLRKTVLRHRALHFDLAAHHSLAFAAGYLVEAKAGLEITLRQRSVHGTRDWRLDDLAIPGATSWREDEHPLEGGGDDVALAVSCARSIRTSVESYVKRSQPSIGRIVELRPPEGPSQLAVLNGWHAFQLAEAINQKIHDLVPGDWPGTFHLFYAGPNGLLFFLGRLSHGPRRIQLYEYDFDAESDSSYTPSLLFPPPRKGEL